MKQPSLFYYNTKTIKSIIEDVAEEFKKEGLTRQKYLECAMRQPTLFTITRKTVKFNIDNIVNEFKNEGLTREKCIKCATYSPQLFFILKDTIKSSVESIIKEFKDKGLTKKRYLECVMKQPALFYLKPEGISDHIKIYDFVIKSKNISTYKNISTTEMLEIILKKCLTYSEKYIYLKFLKQKMFNGQNPEGLKGENYVEEKMKNYLKSHPDQTYSFSVINHEKTQEFIEFAKQFSIDILGKNVFKISVL